MPVGFHGLSRGDAAFGPPFGAAYLVADFVRNYHRKNAAAYIDPALLPGLAYARSGAASAPDSAGNDITFAAGALRKTDKGVWVEPQRANLMLSTAILSTQNVTVTAVAHTLSFKGTGTVTLSGASTAGPLVGTGANNKVSLTFTPTAGTLTLTVTGSITGANLEVGSTPTTWIPTTGAQVTRAADSLQIGSLSLLTDYTIFVEWSDSLVSSRVLDIGGNVLVRRAGSGTTFNGASRERNVASVGGGLTKAAIALSTTDMTGAVNGALAGAASGTFAAVSQTTMFIGNRSSLDASFSGCIRRLAIFARAFSNAELQAITA